MTLWNAEGLKPIGYLVWPLRSLKVRNPFLTLTWPGDLTFGDLGLKFLHKVSNSIVSRYWKMAALRAAVFPLSAKNRRGGHFLPPPPVRVLKGLIFRELETPNLLCADYHSENNNSNEWLLSLLRTNLITFCRCCYTRVCLMRIMEHQVTNDPI